MSEENRRSSDSSGKLTYKEFKNLFSNRAIAIRNSSDIEDRDISVIVDGFVRLSRESQIKVTKVLLVELKDYYIDPLDLKDIKKLEMKHRLAMISLRTFVTKTITISLVGSFMVWLMMTFIEFVIDKKEGVLANIDSFISVFMNIFTL